MPDAVERGLGDAGDSGVADEAGRQLALSGVEREADPIKHRASGGVTRFSFPCHRGTIGRRRGGHEAREAMFRTTVVQGAAPFPHHLGRGLAYSYSLLLRGGGSSINLSPISWCPCLNLRTVRARTAHTDADAALGVLAMATILVVEDDPPIRALVVEALERDRHDVEGVATTAAAQAALNRHTIELVILDLGLPDADGLDFLEELRATHDLPVLVLTARSGVGDRVLGFDTGADDYVVKPVALPELRARVRALLRRQEPAADRLVFGKLEIDLGAREAVLDGQVLELTHKEFEVLALLASQPRKAFSRGDLLRQVWGSSPEYQTTATVTEHVRRLRRRLEIHEPATEWIATVRGVGYRFDPPGED